MFENGHSRSAKTEEASVTMVCIKTAPNLSEKYADESRPIVLDALRMASK